MGRPRLQLFVGTTHKLTNLVRCVHVTILLNVFLRVYFCFSEILPLSVTKAHVMVSKINSTSVAETELAEVSE